MLELFRNCSLIKACYFSEIPGPFFPWFCHLYSALCFWLRPDAVALYPPALFFYEIPFDMMMISLVVELMYAAGVSSSGLTPDPLTLFSHAYWVLHPHRYNPIKLPCTCFSYCQGGKPFWMAAMQLRSLSKHQILWDLEGNHKHNFEGGDMLTNWKYDMSIDMLGKKSSPGFGLSSKLVSFLVCCCSLLLYSCCSRIFSHTGAP